MNKTGKGLLSRTYKELLQINEEKTPNCKKVTKEQVPHRKGNPKCPINI